MNPLNVKCCVCKKCDEKCPEDNMRGEQLCPECGGLSCNIVDDSKLSNNEYHQERSSYIFKTIVLFVVLTAISFFISRMDQSVPVRIYFSAVIYVFLCLVGLIVAYSYKAIVALTSKKQVFVDIIVFYTLLVLGLLYIYGDIKGNTFVNVVNSNSDTNIHVVVQDKVKH